MIANAPENERRSSGINNVVGLWGPRMRKSLVVNDKISGETPSCKVSTHTECRQKKKNNTIECCVRQSDYKFVSAFVLSSVCGRLGTNLEAQLP